jgi:hypothetical protein
MRLRQSRRISTSTRKCDTPYLVLPIRHPCYQTVDNCPKTVDKPRGLWKSRSIVRFLPPISGMLFFLPVLNLDGSKIFSPGVCCSVSFSRLSPQGANASLQAMPQRLVLSIHPCHRWGLSMVLHLSTGPTTTTINQIMHNICGGKNEPLPF